MQTQTRTIFDEKDFRGSGQLLVRNDAVEVDQFFASVAYKVGWIENRDILPFVLFTSLNDGMSLLHGNTASFVEWLNNHKKGFRPIRPEEIGPLFEIIGNRFEDED